MPRVGSERDQLVETKERTRSKDLAFAEQIGKKILAGLPDLQRISQTDFSQAQSQEIEVAWDTMRETYDALVAYYDYFIEMQPPIKIIDSYHQGWQDEQPYASVSVCFSNKKRTIERMFKDKWADNYRATFHQEAEKLLRIIALDFKLDISTMASDIDFLGLRFLPVYRKLFAISNGKHYYSEIQKPLDTKIVWNPEDTLNRVTFIRNGRRYYIGSTGSPSELEKLLDDTVLVTGVTEDLPSQTEDSSSPSFPVLDVDGTLTSDNDWRTFFTQAAKKLFDYFKQNQIAYVLWSRADFYRIREVVAEIKRLEFPSPQVACFFGERTWPFNTIRPSGSNFQFAPDTAEEIEAQISKAVVRLGIDLKESGYGSLPELVNLILICISNKRDSNLSGEFASQGKCPWLIPLAEVGSTLEPEAAKALFANGVLVDDRGTSTIPSAHTLGFNFIHVTKPESVAEAIPFFS